MNNNNQLKKIALLYGSFNGEEEISRLSAVNIIEQYNNCFLENNKKYQLILVEINRSGFFVMNDRVKEKIDLNHFSYRNNKHFFDGIFFIVHGSPIEDGKLQGYFELKKIPYIGSSGMVSTLTFNKYYCSKFLASFGIQIPRSYLISQGNLFDWNEFPCFAKPNRGGSSLGAGIISDRKELEIFLQKGFKSFNEYLIEELIEGREITCGIFKSKNQITVLPLTEIISKNKFFDFKAKYYGESEEITPAKISSDLTNEIQTLTKKIFSKLNCGGFARADYIVSKNKIYFIEINTIPGFTKNSLIPQQITAAKISIGKFIDLMLNEIIR